jgi:hypothetical protein
MNNLYNLLHGLQLDQDLPSRYQIKLVGPNLRSFKLIRDRLFRFEPDRSIGQGDAHSVLVDRLKKAWPERPVYRKCGGDDLRETSSWRFAVFRDPVTSSRPS